MKYRKQKIRKISGFILKLISILNCKQNTQTIQYNSGQNSFIIKNVRKFTQNILPLYFKHKNLSSFIRQVNLYDFHKKNNKQQIYQHQYFIINNNKLLKKIKRKTIIKENHIKNIKNPKINLKNQHNNNQQDNQNNNIANQNNNKANPSININNSQSIINNAIYNIKDLTQLQCLLNNQNLLHVQLIKQNNILKKQQILKTINTSQQILRILTNILISQLNQSTITFQVYNKIYQYVKFEQTKLKELRKSLDTMNLVNSFINVNKNTNTNTNILYNLNLIHNQLPLICKQGETQFIKIIKDLVKVPLNPIQNKNTIKYFIQIIYKIVIDLISKQQIKYINETLNFKKLQLTNLLSLSLSMSTPMSMPMSNPIPNVMSNTIPNLIPNVMSNAISIPIIIPIINSNNNNIKNHENQLQMQLLGDKQNNLYQDKVNKNDNRQDEKQNKRQDKKQDKKQDKNKYNPIINNNKKNNNNKRHISNNDNDVDYKPSRFQ